MVKAIEDLTPEERAYLAFHARREAQNEEDFRYWHPDPEERRRRRARWYEITDWLQSY